jgi:hypothetical protein
MASPTETARAHLDRLTPATALLRALLLCEPADQRPRRPNAGSRPGRASIPPAQTARSACARDRHRLLS